MFCEENYSCNSQPTQYKKKSKDNSGENHKKKHKNHVKKHCSNLKYFLKKKLQS